MVHIGKKQHFWVYMGWDEELQVEYSFCDRCGKYRAKGVIIPKKQFLERHNAGKVEIR